MWRKAQWLVYTGRDMFWDHLLRRVRVSAGVWFRDQSPRSSPTGRGSDPPPPFASLRREVDSARGTDPRKICGLIARISSATGFELSDALRDRIAQAELYCRSTVRGGVPPDRLADALSHFFRNLLAPDTLCTDASEVEWAREAAVKAVPGLFAPAAGTSSREAISPAGAVFIALLMLRLKLWGPLALPPDVWPRVSCLPPSGGHAHQYARSANRLGGRSVSSEDTSLRSRIRAILADPDNAGDLTVPFGF